MNGNSVKERIDDFNRQNKPFYIVEQDDGTYSLCLPLDFLSDEYCDYGQGAFDAYAVEQGVSPRNERGIRQYGSGYDWEAAFKKAFEHEPKLKSISFDSECGGFYCDCGELSVLEKFGRRFKELCDDAERFTPIVSAGIREEEARREEEQRRMETVRGYLTKYPTTTFEIRTPDGDVEITPKDGQKLLDGSLKTIDKGGTVFEAEELLNLRVCAVRSDFFDANRFQIKTEPGQEETPTCEMELR